MSKRELLHEGQRFGQSRWQVVNAEPVRKLRVNGHSQYLEDFYWCRCDCGSIRLVRASAMRHGTSTSCGCATREAFARLSGRQVARAVIDREDTKNHAADYDKMVALGQEQLKHKPPMRRWV